MIQIKHALDSLHTQQLITKIMKRLNKVFCTAFMLMLLVTGVNAQKAPSQRFLSEAPYQRDGWATWAKDLAPNSYGFGTGQANDFIAAHRYEAADIEQFAGRHLSRVSFAAKEASAQYTIKIYKGGNEYAPGELIREIPATNVAVDVWNNVEIVPSVEIDPTQDLWVGVHCVSSTGYPMGHDYGPQIDGKGNWYYWDGAWITAHDPEQPNSNLNIMNFCIKFFTQETAVTSAQAPAIADNFVVTPFENMAYAATITWLTPLTDINGNALQNLTKVSIVRDGQVIYSQENPTVGSTGEYVDYEIDQLNWHDYSIYYTNNNGDGVYDTRTVCVGHMYTVNIVGNRTVTITDAYIYDDGGKFENYSNNCNGYLVVMPNNPNMGIQIYGKFLGERDFDVLEIYDGEGIEGTMLARFSSNDELEIPVITSTTGPMTIRFFSDSSVNFDGFEIRATTVDVNTQCIPPVNMEITNINDNSVSLKWEPAEGQNPDHYCVRYKKSVDTEYTIVDNITSTQCQINDLVNNTNYEWSVKSVCSENNESAWTPAIAFWTLCLPETNDYEDDFERYSLGDVPTCWEQIDIMNYQDRQYPCIETYDGHAHSGEDFLKLWMNPATHYNTIAMPAFDGDIRSLEISFYARYNVNVPVFTIGIMEGLTFVPLQNINLSTAYQQFTFNIAEMNYSGDGNRIAFQSYNMGVAHVFIDDINVTINHSICEPPVDLTASLEGANVQLSWTASPQGVKYIVSRNGQNIATDVEGTSYTDTMVEAGEQCYVVKAVNSDGIVSSPSNQACITVTATAENNNSYNIYPNPASDILYVRGNDITTIVLTNNMGVVISKVESSNNETMTINTSELANGIYYVRMTTSEGKTITEKVVVLK